MFVSHLLQCQCAHAVPGSNHVLVFVTHAGPHTEAFSVTLVALLSFKKTINKFLYIILNYDK